MSSSEQGEPPSKTPSFSTKLSRHMRNQHRPTFHGEGLREKTWCQALLHGHLALPQLGWTFLVYGYHGLWVNVMAKVKQ